MIAKTESELIAIAIADRITFLNITLGNIPAEDVSCKNAILLELCGLYEMVIKYDIPISSVY